MAQELLENKANPNVKDAKGSTALHYAIPMVATTQVESRSALHIAQAIIQCGKADLDVQNAQGVRPIFQCVEIRHNSLLNLMIQHKVALDVWDSGGCTPLHRLSYQACEDPGEECQKRAELVIKGELSGSESEGYIYFLGGILGWYFQTTTSKSECKTALRISTQNSENNNNHSMFRV